MSVFFFEGGGGALRRRLINAYQKHPGTGTHIVKAKFVSFFNYLVRTISFPNKNHTALGMVVTKLRRILRNDRFRSPTSYWKKGNIIPSQN